MGAVKTRLAKNIGNDAAAHCHQTLAEHCLQMAAGAELAPLQLWCTPDTEHSFFHQQSVALPLSLQQQSGQDLGAKMSHAFDMALLDAEYALVIGTDCPALTRDYMDLALSMLQAGAPAVIGPAEDGGYVLLGLRKNTKQLFKDMPWGSDEVFEKTCRQLADGYRVLPMLWDIDVIDDLRRLKQEVAQLDLSDDLRRYLSRIP